MIDLGAAGRPRSSLRQVIVASLIGTTIEWYDFFLYGTASALVFGKVFFPKSDPVAGLLFALTSNAVGFAARPIGGLVFGHFGDRIGRKRLLMLSLVMMGVSSALMGLLPGYAQIGVAAPVLLTLLRLVQGFSVGGEWGGAVLMASEFGDAERRGWWAGWPQAGVPLGNMLAAAVLLAMAQAQSERDFVGWGWRIPFLLSAVLVGIGWWVRSRLSESPAFEAVARAEQVEKAPALVALRERPGGIAVGAGLRLGENICFYVMVTYSLAFLAEQVRVPYTLALAAVAVGAVAEALTLPVFAGLSDRIGRRPIYAFGAGGMAVWIFAFFGLLQTGAALPILAAIVVGLVLHGAMYGPQAAFISELFPTRYRFSGASIAYQLTSIFAGSLAPIIAVALYQQAKSTLPISIYVAGACLVSVIAALVARETKGLSFAAIDARDGAASAPERLPSASPSP